MWLNRQLSLICGIGLVMFGCTNAPKPKGSVEERAKHQSANNFYNAGMIRCSIDGISFDDVCDYAVYKEPKLPIRVVIESVAVKTSIKYRVLYFTSKGFISKNKKDVIHFHKTASDHYQITIGRENYLLPARNLHYQPDIKEDNDNTKNNSNETPLKEYEAPKKEEIKKEVVIPKEIEEPIAQPVTTKTVKKAPTPKEPQGTKRKFKR
jgi:hypothetical protein